MVKIEFQKTAFLKSEGDGWFNRNNNVKNVSNGYKIICKYLKADSKILEIGCADGRNLNYFKKQFGCECYGIDPSIKAIKHGKQLYPELNLTLGTADELAFSNEFFDLVIYGFCLYLADRVLLSKIVAEGDRVTKDKGFLAIIDFDSKLPIEKQYIHFAGVKSYKFDYSSLFLAYPHYTLAEKFPYSHKNFNFEKELDERVATSILYKDYDAYLEF